MTDKQNSETQRYRAFRQLLRKRLTFISHFRKSDQKSYLSRDLEPLLDCDEAFQRLLHNWHEIFRSALEAGDPALSQVNIVVVQVQQWVEQFDGRIREFEDSYGQVSETTLLSSDPHITGVAVAVAFEEQVF